MHSTETVATHPANDPSSTLFEGSTERTTSISHVSNVESSSNGTNHFVTEFSSTEGFERSALQRGLYSGLINVKFFKLFLLKKTVPTA